MISVITIDPTSLMKGRIMSKASKEIASFVIGPAGGVATLIGILPQMTTSPITLFLVGASFIGAILLTISLRKDGFSWARSILISLIIPIGTFALIYGFMWYFLHSGKVTFDMDFSAP